MTVALAAMLLSGGCGGGSGGTGTAAVPSPPSGGSSGGNNCTTTVEPAGDFGQTTLDIGLCYGVAAIEPPSDMQVMGGGLAMSDVDRDGFVDLYVTHGMNEKGRLFLFDGTTFVAAEDNAGIQPRSIDNAGYFVDVNSDGWDDFLSVQYEANVIEIFFNDQTGQFFEDTASTGIYVEKPTYSVAASDYDLDGDVDLFFAHWGPVWRENEPLTEYLWQNDGDGTFTDRSESVEIVPSFRPPPYDDLLAEHSFTPIFADIDGDRYPDLLLASDFEASQVLMNDGGSSFRDATTDVISDENGMGATVADYDRDGDLDWFVSSIYFSGKEKSYLGGTSGNRLYANDGNGVFSDVTDDAGVRDGDWGWGSCFADFDNDGHVDLFHTNGMRSIGSRDGDTADPLYDFFADESRLFMAQGDGTFVERAQTAGIHHHAQGRGLICTDYDNDGLVDILIANNGQSPTVYRNRMGTANHYLEVDLEGPPSNRRGVGALVIVESASGTQTLPVVLGSNYLSQPPTTLHFGLGADDEASVTVRWPGTAGAETRLENVAVDQRLTISADSTP